MATISSLRRKLSARQHEQGVTLQPKGPGYLQTDHKTKNLTLNWQFCHLGTENVYFSSHLWIYFQAVGRFTAGFAHSVLGFRGLHADLGEISFSEVLGMMDISP